jgi:hypothetical protein
MSEKEKIISNFLHMAETDAEYQNWKESPEGIARAEELKAMTREEKIAACIELFTR